MPPINTQLQEILAKAQENLPKLQEALKGSELSEEEQQEIHHAVASLQRIGEKAAAAKAETEKEKAEQSTTDKNEI